MATFGSKKFEEQSVRVYIKENYCEAPNDDCWLPIHPSRIPGQPDHKTCAACTGNFDNRYRAMKTSMEREQQDTVVKLVKDSCLIGACKTGSFDCGVCGQRVRDIKATTKQYFKLQKQACDAYLLRVYGVPRDGIGFEHEDFNSKIKSGMEVAHKVGFYMNWRPFVAEDGGFQCDYPALFFNMLIENAQELALIIPPYTVIPQSNQSGSSIKRLSKDLIGSVQSGVASQIERLRRQESIKSRVEAEPYAWEPMTVEHQKENARRYSYSPSPELPSSPSPGLPSSTTSNRLVEESKSLFQKGNEKIQSTAPVLSGIVEKEKRKVEKLSGIMKDKFHAYKERLAGDRRTS